MRTRQNKRDMFVSFIDILYALAIGTGFLKFPEDPLANALGTAVFAYTLLVAAHDWYEYHNNAVYIPDNRLLMYFIIQIFVLLTLNQMFVHSVGPSLVGWLVYAGIFSSLNAGWNAITPFEGHLIYAVGSGSVAVVVFMFARFYQPLTCYISGIDGRWVILVLTIIIRTTTYLYIRRKVR